MAKEGVITISLERYTDLLRMERIYEQMEAAGFVEMWEEEKAFNWLEKDDEEE